MYSWLRSQVKMVDFPRRFPAIQFASGDERRCAVRTATVVPSQIDTLIDAFARGFAVDWDVIRAYVTARGTDAPPAFSRVNDVPRATGRDVGRRDWSARPITDVAQFSRLLEAWPNTVSMMLEEGRYKTQLADCVSTLLALDQGGLVAKAYVGGYGRDVPAQHSSIHITPVPCTVPCMDQVLGHPTSWRIQLARLAGAGWAASVRPVGGGMEGVPQRACGTAAQHGLGLSTGA